MLTERQVVINPRASQTTWTVSPPVGTLLPFTSPSPLISLSVLISAEVPENMSNQWLESVARGTVHVFTEHILKIRELTEQSTKQLVMDIGT